MGHVSCRYAEHVVAWAYNAEPVKVTSDLIRGRYSLNWDCKNFGRLHVTLKEAL